MLSIQQTQHLVRVLRHMSGLHSFEYNLVWWWTRHGGSRVEGYLCHCCTVHRDGERRRRTPHNYKQTWQTSHAAEADWLICRQPGLPTPEGNWGIPSQMREQPLVWGRTSCGATQKPTSPSSHTKLSKGDETLVARSGVLREENSYMTDRKHI